MLAALVAVTITVVLTFAGPAAARPATIASTHHRPGCHSLRCDHVADRAYQRHLKRKREAREAREAREVPPISAHAACIIRKESGGDPKQVTGIYSGIGQWEQSRWESDGGLRYAPTPTQATYAQQVKVLVGEGDAGMSQQQGQYDGCG
jgi:hypothetical protein